MKIRRLVIKNFRGIRELDWAIPNEGMFCLIGKGDSSKSTILDAIRYNFYPYWKLSLSDSDFHNCNMDEPIVIEAVVGELIDEFCTINKYGQHLRGWDAPNLTIADEPDDDLENVLTIRLTVDRDMEPRWRVVNDRNPDGVEFKTADRGKVCVGLIGSYSEKEFSWSNGTSLAKQTDEQNLAESLINVSRSARNALDASRAKDLKSFDEAAHKSEVVAKTLGVPVRDKFKAQLDLNSINIKIGGLALHDGEIPLRQLGLGSRRMLLCGIQTMGLESGHITLFDEVELGLEPHRIARLIKHIKGDKNGQYFLSTHSPVVLREFAVKELYVVHNDNGDVLIKPASDPSLVEYEIQGKIRSSAEAFLARKVVICEGSTEVGFMRGFDDYQLNEGLDPLSFHGVALLDVRGASKLKSMAEAFNSLGYIVAVMADGDAQDQFSDTDKDILIKQGIDVQMWAGNLSLEERVMQDLPWDLVLESALFASELGFPVQDNVKSALNMNVDNEISNWIETPELRVAIGKAAKNSGWFKSTTKGGLWFKKISTAFAVDGFDKTDLAVKLNHVWVWAEND